MKNGFDLGLVLLCLALLFLVLGGILVAINDHKVKTVEQKEKKKIKSNNNRHMGYKSDPKLDRLVAEAQSWIAEYKEDFLRDDILEVQVYANLIFEKAKMILESLDTKKLAKQMKKDQMNIDFVVLNVIQNVAVTELQEIAFGKIKGHPDHIHESVEVYNYINQKKIDLHYISPLQYEDNKLLIDNLLRMAYGLPIKQKNNSEFKEIEYISSLSEKDAGKRVQIKGFVYYIYPQKDRDAIIELYQPNQRDSGGWDIRVNFEDNDDLQKIFNGINLNEVVEKAKVISSEQEVTLCGKLIKSKYIPHVEMMNARVL